MSLVLWFVCPTCLVHFKAYMHLTRMCFPSKAHYLRVSHASLWRAVRNCFAWILRYLSRGDPCSLSMPFAYTLCMKMRLCPTLPCVWPSHMLRQTARMAFEFAVVLVYLTRPTRLCSARLSLLLSGCLRYVSSDLQKHQTRLCFALRSSLFTCIPLACCSHLLHVDSALLPTSVILVRLVRVYTSRMTHLYHTLPLASTVSILITYGRRRGQPSSSSSEVSLSIYKQKGQSYVQS